jgi:hypothetical protein
LPRALDAFSLCKPRKNKLSSPVALRNYRDTDAVHVNGVALAAFEQFSLQYSEGQGGGPRTDRGVHEAGEEGRITRHCSSHKPVMTVALPMYIKMGFERQHDAPSIYDVPYAVYLKRLEARSALR